MKKALSLLLAALLLAGCAAQPASESAASPPPDSVAVESPSRPLATPSGEGAAQASQVVEATLSSGVVVQAEVRYPPVDFSSLASYQASLHRFDPQQARQLLLGDAPLAQEEQQAVKGSTFQDAMWHMYVTEDGQNLVVIEENLYYFNDGWNQDTTQYFYPGPESLDYNGDAFQTGKELAFATAEECFTQAKETLSQLGIEVRTATTASPWTATAARTSPCCATRSTKWTAAACRGEGKSRAKKALTTWKNRATVNLFGR